MSVAFVERTNVPLCALIVKVYVPAWLGRVAEPSLVKDEDEELDDFETPPPQPVATNARARIASSAVAAQNLRERLRSPKTNIPKVRPGNHIAKDPCPLKRLAVVPLLAEMVSLAVSFFVPGTTTGWSNVQVTPAGRLPHPRVTGTSKLPLGVIVTEVETELPGSTEIFVGVAARFKSALLGTEGLFPSEV